MSCWAVNVKREQKLVSTWWKKNTASLVFFNTLCHFQTGYRGSTDVAVGVNDKIYFFSNKFTSFGPLDVQVFRTGTIKYYSELVIRTVYHLTLVFLLQIITNGVFWEMKMIQLSMRACLTIYVGGLLLSTRTWFGKLWILFGISIIKTSTELT